MAIIVALILAVLTGASLFKVSQKGKKNLSGFFGFLKIVSSDLVQQPKPITYAVLTNRLSTVSSLKPFLSMGKKAKFAFRVMLLAILTFIVGASWNFAVNVFVDETSAFSTFQSIAHTIWVGIIFLFIVDLIFRLFMLTINNIYSGLSDEGYADITGKFLAIAIITLLIALVIFMPNDLSYVLTTGIDKKYLYLTVLAASVFVWLILFSLLFKTMLDPTKLLTKNATVKQAKDVSSQIIKGGLLIMVFLFFAMFAVVYSLETVDPTSWRFPVGKERLYSIYWVATTMSTVGFGDFGPLTDGAIFVSLGIFFTSVVTIGIFVGTVFDKHEIEEDEETKKARTNYLYVDEMSLAELRKFCRTEGIKVPSSSSKEEIIEILERVLS